MTFGFQVIGDGGIQIDANYRNLMLVAKGTTAILMSAGSVEAVSYTGAAGCTPVLALSCTRLAAVMYVVVSGNTWTWHISVLYRPMSGTFDDGSSGVVHMPATINWYVFDKPPAAPSTGFGLVVRDETGGVVFDSSRRSMRVVGQVASQSIVGYSANSSFPSPGTFTGAAGRSYACVYAGTRYRLHQCRDMLFWQTGYVVDGFSVNGASVVVGDALPFYNLTGFGSYALSIYSGSAQNNLVLDVTGY